MQLKPHRPYFGYKRCIPAERCNNYKPNSVPNKKALEKQGLKKKNVYKRNTQCVELIHNVWKCYTILSTVTLIIDSTTLSDNLRINNEYVRHEPAGTLPVL